MPFSDTQPGSNLNAIALWSNPGIVQDGNSNAATLMQSGVGHGASIMQMGNSNTATITQSN